MAKSGKDFLFRKTVFYLFQSKFINTFTLLPKNCIYDFVSKIGVSLCAYYSDHLPWLEIDRISGPECLILCKNLTILIIIVTRKHLLFAYIYYFPLLNKLDMYYTHFTDEKIDSRLNNLLIYLYI